MTIIKNDTLRDIRFIGWYKHIIFDRIKKIYVGNHKKMSVVKGLGFFKHNGKKVAISSDEWVKVTDGDYDAKYGVKS